MKTLSTSAAVLTCILLSMICLPGFQPANRTEATLKGKETASNSSSSKTADQTDQVEDAAIQYEISSKSAIKVPSLKELLRNSIRPVGKTLYVWGGGWNEEDTGAGEEARKIGLSSRWEEFFNENDAAYNFQDSLYQIHDGLDCSGFIGWTLYNTFNNSDGREGLVVLSAQTGDALAARGWGKVIPAENVENHMPGDLMYSDSHVYMVLGEYDDGSVLLIHSAPPGGVQISGTPSFDGNEHSMASHIADTLMQKYYPDFYSRYSSQTTDSSFLYGFSQFRWNPETMSDAQSIQSKTPDQIINLLFPE